MESRQAERARAAERTAGERSFEKRARRGRRARPPAPQTGGAAQGGVGAAGGLEELQKATAGARAGAANQRRDPEEKKSKRGTEETAGAEAHGEVSRPAEEGGGRAARAAERSAAAGRERGASQAGG